MMQYKTKALTFEARQFTAQTTMADITDLQLYLNATLDVLDGVLFIPSSTGQPIAVQQGSWIIKWSDNSFTFMGDSTFKRFTDPA